VRALDVNHDGLIGVDEFIEGCIAFKSHGVKDFGSVIREQQHQFDKMCILIKQFVEHQKEQICRYTAANAETLRASDRSSAGIDNALGEGATVFL